MISILPYLDQITAVRPEPVDQPKYGHKPKPVGKPKPCTPHDGGAQLTLKIGGLLLVADQHGGAIHDGMLRCAVYMIAPAPHITAPFTNLQRLLVVALERKS